jgi:hypothetical protein
MCCWPGLRGVWLAGQPLALFWAAACAVLLNLGLVATFVWPQLLSAQTVQIIWSAVAAIWLGSAWYQFRQARRQADAPAFTATEDALFIQAQGEYLKGNWEQAEWMLRRRLASDSRDVESRLLLLTLYRRRRRTDLVSEQLRLLKRLDGAAAWSDEIERESRFLSAAEPTHGESAQHAESPALSPDSTDHVETRKIDTNSVRHAA